LPDTRSTELLVRQLDLFVRELASDLAEEGVDAQVQARVKSAASMEAKMLRKGLSWDEVSDRLAVRLIVDDIATAYAMLARIERDRPVRWSERDDYIVHPKGNAYQSLHTVVRSTAGAWIEVQIRTYVMHERAERGSASHDAYKKR